MVINGDNTCDGGGLCSSVSDAADIRMRRGFDADRSVTADGSVTIIGNRAMGRDNPWRNDR